ncbi:unnamed protein product [Protopolystoma xenopodis]|uniref:Uncharacterized protein n=1 Tax=Protopolystoma xenopodis TaxID=117903 RepID=A0A3S5A5E0_9PLAT|nr:unnamed protein product [Protopolystoma xenopodis]
MPAIACAGCPGPMLFWPPDQLSSPGRRLLPSPPASLAPGPGVRGQRRTEFSAKPASNWQKGCDQSVRPMASSPATVSAFSTSATLTHSTPALDPVSTATAETVSIAGSAPASQPAVHTVASSVWPPPVGPGLMAGLELETAASHLPALSTAPPAPSLMEQLAQVRVYPLLVPADEV